MSKLVNFIKSDKLSFFIRLLSGGMILYAEVPKLADIEKLSVYAVYKYSFFPMHAEFFGQTVNVARVFGTMGPYIGILVGLGLIFGVFTRLSAVGWLSMCVMFIVMKLNFLYILDRPAAPCGCFPGPLSNLLMTQSIWIDIVSIPLMLQVMFANRERKFLSMWSLMPEPLRLSWLNKVW
jgi:uncharacterized membrane protein YphA (DoxX/SURF4 family)